MNSPTLLIPALLLLAAFGVPKPSTAQEIVALCIGNDAYHKPDDVLDTPVADATLMRDTLLALKGVKVSEEDVMLVTNATRIQMSQALRTFKAKAAGAKLALIFYSGHGMEDTPVGETRPETFLLPVDADITSLDVLPDLSIPLGDVLKAFEGSGGARAVILDCCRTGAPSANGALARAGKSTKSLDADVKRALGAAVVPEGTLIAFAAGPGRKAAAFLEKDDNHSPFTRFLTDEMKGAGGDLVTVVNAATRITKQRTENRQVPHVEVRGDLSLLTDFMIGGGRKANDAELAALRAELEEARKAAMANVTNSGNAESVGQGTKRSGVVSYLKEGSTPGEERDFDLGNGVSMTMCWIPPGKFRMGTPPTETNDEETLAFEKQRTVTLTKGFWMSKYEVTQSQWIAVTGISLLKQFAKADEERKSADDYTLSYLLSCNSLGDNFPMHLVSHFDCFRFGRDLENKIANEIGGTWVAKLPTEAQWEYAARANTTTAVYSGDLVYTKDGKMESDEYFDSLMKIGWTVTNEPFEQNDEKPEYEALRERFRSNGNTARVGQLLPNAFGLHDMIGNVMELCEDYEAIYDPADLVDPKGPEKGTAKIVRGASYMHSFFVCRAAQRFTIESEKRRSNIGFRIILERK